MVRSASRTGSLYPQKCFWYLFSLGAESTPGPWYGWKEYVTESRDRTTSSAAQRLNPYATQGPLFISIDVFKKNNLEKRKEQKFNCGL